MSLTNYNSIIPKPSTIINIDSFQKEKSDLEIQRQKELEINSKKNIPENIKKVNENNINKYYDNQQFLLDSKIKEVEENSGKDSNKYYLLENNKIEFQNKLKTQTNSINQLKSISLSSIPLNISSSVSVIIDKLIQTIFSKNNEISKNVDLINDKIQNIKNQNDIVLCRSLRNGVLNIISFNRNNIKSIKSIIDVINVIISVIPAILLFLQVNPTPLMFSTAGVVDVFEKYRNKLEDLVKSLTILLGITSQLLNNLILDLNYQESRLQIIGNILDSNVENMTSNDIKNMLDSYSIGLGEVKDITYKGFRFFIHEDPDPKYIIKGFKRRFATAVDNDNNDVLKSSYSYTLEPQVLIEELKLLIDQNNLSIE